MEIQKTTSMVEEIVNSITHGMGLLVSIIGVAYLILKNLPVAEFWKLTGLSIFGLSVILTYTFSTLYHSLYFTKANPVFKRLDHSGIFVLISGTYTPFVLIFLKNNIGLALLVFLWLAAAAGIVYKAIFINRLKKLQLIIFLSLGWVGILILGPIVSVMPLPVILLLILGGCFYSFGTIFYAWKSLKFNHSIWHLFVFLGTASHFLALVYI